ncbi:uncharacterized protein Tco025E_05644 [Trypanosoma conorhini]|uniref:Uncharacterized protein n=1 Tax=Trypanosoma conorhini TaxID=83891 RepID=A0A422PB81_9TRYP|nr:uncharacterized protein Tco025E_05644 [Trypanosoma conorhini]RNF14961.1 hypothetical protein Tco025E_05644 [Trypanosoma conorhini]
MLHPPRNRRDEKPDVARGDFKCPLLKLPLWDQPALINWEPLEPPSPYLPVVQKRAYPSVVSGMLRAALASRSPEREAHASTPALAVAEAPQEMTFEEEAAAQRRLFTEESEARETIVFAEQFESTRLWVEVLHCISVILEVDIPSAEEEARSAYEREENRLRMCYLIEMDTVGRCIKKRLEEAMRRSISQLMPSHKEGRTSIMNEEAGELAGILDWFKKKRPFGMRLPACLGGEQRRMQPRKPVGGHRVTHRGRGSRNLVPKVQTKVCPELESWPDVFPEPSYMEEGRMAWASVKSSRYGQLKGRTSVKDVVEQEGAAREGLLAEEAGKWLPIIALAVDEQHEAMQQAQKRERAEKVAMEEKLEELQKRDAILAKLENEDAVEREMSAIKQLERREAGVEDAAAVEHEIAVVRQLQEREASLENEDAVTHEIAAIKLLKEREASLENEDAVMHEIAAIKQLQEREFRFQAQLNRADNTLAKAEPGALQLHGPAGGDGVGHDSDLESRKELDARDEKSSSWDSDSNGPPLYPMLNIVLSTALERDSYAGLHNPGFAALAEAECLLAACEGRNAGSAAQAFVSASRMPLCPIYLMQGLWWSCNSTGEATGPGAAHVVGEDAPHLHGLVKLEAASRSVFLRDQIAAVWKLYQQAAQEASTISGTKYGEIYYVGVRMPSTA